MQPLYAFGTESVPMVRCHEPSANPTAVLSREARMLSVRGRHWFGIATANPIDVSNVGLVLAVFNDASPGNPKNYSESSSRGGFVLATNFNAGVFPMASIDLSLSGSVDNYKPHHGVVPGYAETAAQGAANIIVPNHAAIAGRPVHLAWMFRYYSDYAHQLWTLKANLVVTIERG